VTRLSTLISNTPQGAGQPLKIKQITDQKLRTETSGAREEAKDEKAPEK